MNLEKEIGLSFYYQSNIEFANKCLFNLYESDQLNGEYQQRNVDELLESFGSYKNQFKQAIYIADQIKDRLIKGRTISSRTFYIDLDPDLKFNDFFDEIVLCISSFSLVSNAEVNRSNPINFTVNYNDIDSNLPKTIVLNITGRTTARFLTNYLSGIIAHELLHAYEDYQLSSSYDMELLKLEENPDASIRNIPKNIQDRLNNDFYYEWFNIYRTGKKLIGKPESLHHQTIDFSYLNYVLNAEEINANLAQLNQEINANKHIVHNVTKLMTVVKNTGTYKRWQQTESLVNMCSNYSDRDKEMILSDLHRISDLEDSELGQWTMQDLNKRIFVLKKRFMRLKNKMISNTDKLFTDILSRY